MPDDSIMDMVNNIESMYNDKQNLFEKWVEEGKDWDKKQALTEARGLATHFAEALEGGMVRGKYSERDINTAAREMLQEFITEELPKWSVTSAPKVESEPASAAWTEYELEQAKKNEALAQEIGLDRLRLLMPVANDRIRAALLRGDKHFRSIPLRKWDAMAVRLQVPGLSLSEKVGLLKHVAAFHYDMGRASMGAVEGWVITHDGETIKAGLQNTLEAINWIHQRHSYSADHAVLHEGYDIVHVRGGKVDWSYKRDLLKRKR